MRSCHLRGGLFGSSTTSHLSPFRVPAYTTAGDGQALAAQARTTRVRKLPSLSQHNPPPQTLRSIWALMARRTLSKRAARQSRTGICFLRVPLSLKGPHKRKEGGVGSSWRVSFPLVKQAAANTYSLPSKRNVRNAQWRENKSNIGHTEGAGIYLLIYFTNP